MYAQFFQMASYTQVTPQISVCHYLPHTYIRTDGRSDMIKVIVTGRNVSMHVKIPEVYTKRTKSAE